MDRTVSVCESQEPRLRWGMLSHVSCLCLSFQKDIKLSGDDTAQPFTSPGGLGAVGAAVGKGGSLLLLVFFAKERVLSTRISLITFHVHFKNA